MSIVSVTPLCTNVKVVLALFPAASVAVTVNTLVPGLSGRFCSQNCPPRSTNPLNVCTLLLVSVVCAVTVAVSSSNIPRKVMLLPEISMPSCGHVIATAGGVVSPVVSKM